MKALYGMGWYFGISCLVVGIVVRWLEYMDRKLLPTCDYCGNIYEDDHVDYWEIEGDTVCKCWLCELEEMANGS